MRRLAETARDLILHVGWECLNSGGRVFPPADPVEYLLCRTVMMLTLRPLHVLVLVEFIEPSSWTMHRVPRTVKNESIWTHWERGTYPREGLVEA